MGSPKHFQSLGRAEHTRVLTTKTAFWYTYKGSARDSGGKEKSSLIALSLLFLSLAFTLSFFSSLL